MLKNEFKVLKAYASPAIKTEIFSPCSQYLLTTSPSFGEGGHAGKQGNYYDDVDEY